MHHTLETKSRIVLRIPKHLLCVKVFVLLEVMFYSIRFEFFFKYHILVLPPLCYEGPIQSGLVGLKCYCHAKFYALQNQIYKVDLFR